MRSVLLSVSILAAMPISLGVVAMARQATDPSVERDESAETCRWVESTIAQGGGTIECSARSYELAPLQSLSRGLSWF